MAPTLLITSEILIDRPLLAAALVGATGAVMSRRFGDEARQWEKSYRHILEDWDHYWADLNLAEQDSLRQWREGRWRVVRALFRLTAQRTPSDESMVLHLDKLPREVGRECGDVWISGAVAGLRALGAAGARTIIIAPTQPSALIWGLIDGAEISGAVSSVLGPDELGQVGLDDGAAEMLMRQTGGEPGQTWIVSRQAGGPSIAPPDDLSKLADIVFTQGG